MFELNRSQIIPGSKTQNKTVSLSETRAGQWLRIHSLPDGDYYPQFIRLGIHEGQRVKCLERLPGGTIVLQKNRQQIAVGHLLARNIRVVILEHKPS
jgi:Fe2+ transport system protein FeoA